MEDALSKGNMVFTFCFFGLLASLLQTICFEALEKVNLLNTNNIQKKVLSLIEYFSKLLDSFLQPNPPVCGGVG